ncbi:hypothetical protein C8R44DRAFT_981960 [Mycena epipterygia]|nr:hypothetical protein C8R44DRAFT_981960 [Mycena epipterygia]
MKKLSNKTVTSDPWRAAFKRSGLCELIQNIINPEVRYEMDKPHVQKSYTDRNWRSFLGDIHYKSTPVEHCTVLPNPINGKYILPINILLKAMSDPRFTINMSMQCQHIFFASSLANWTFEWHRFIAPTLRSMTMHWPAPIADWDIETLYRNLCSLDFETFKLPDAGPAWEDLKFVLCEAQLERAHHRHVRQTWSRPADPNFNPSPSSEPPSPSTSAGSKATAKAHDTRVYPPIPTKKPKKRSEKPQISYDDPVFVSSAYNNADPMKVPFCKTCSHLPEEDDHCYRRIFVDRRQQVEIDSWTGALMTCAPLNDFVKTSKLVINPDCLGFQAITARPDVLDRCKRDRNVIINRANSTSVGGVQFRPWDQHTMQDMRASHSLVGRSVTPQRRSKTTQEQGDMCLAGSRVPHGGLAADGYRPYAHHNANTTDGVEALFAHARDADTMTETVRGFAPGVINDIKHTVTKAGINRMGKMGMNSFYCWEYGAPLHRDNDATWSLCCQLWKDTPYKDEYNFAYAEWGCYIVTEENCVWYFNPSELHGTVLPRTSSQSAALSRGTHTTVRQVDQEKASYYENIPLMARAEVHQFKHGPARISYTRFEGFPDPDQEPQVGDLAHIDGHWKVYSLSKTWLPAPPKTPHPDSVQLKTVNSVPKVLSEAGFWVSGSTYTNHLKLKGTDSALSAHASDEAQAVSPPASKKRKMDHTPAEPTSGHCVNSWATELKKLYCKPPISPFPPSVLSVATQILQQLSLHSQPIPFLSCGPILQPASAPYPSTTLALEDLLALGHDLISPDVLGEGQSSTQEPVARFIERLACRHPSEKLAALMNIPATPRGLGQCMFQFTDMLATLGPGVAIRRNEDTFSQTDLQQLAPPPPVEPAAQPTNRKDIQKAIADRALFLEQLSHREWVSTALCPPGWISPMHIDHAGLAEAIVHCGGAKLWLVWPPTVHNLAWWNLKHPAHVDFPSMLLAVRELEHLKVLHVTEPCSFIIPPFHLHAVLTFTLASHLGVSFAHPSFWTEAECGLLYAQKLIRNTRYPDSLKRHLVEQVLDERSIWERTGHKEALEGVDKWLEETRIIYDVIRSKEESVA